MKSLKTNIKKPIFGSNVLNDQFSVCYKNTDATAAKRAYGFQKLKTV